ncbi:hypothetical protein KKA47_00745 [bacterium]|nr:hypothetical protein [bacterium]
MKRIIIYIAITLVVAALFPNQVHAELNFEEAIKLCSESDVTNTTVKKYEFNVAELIGNPDKIIGAMTMLSAAPVVWCNHSTWNPETKQHDNVEGCKLYQAICLSINYGEVEEINFDLIKPLLVSVNNAILKNDIPIVLNFKGENGQTLNLTKSDDYCESPEEYMTYLENKGDLDGDGTSDGNKSSYYDEEATNKFAEGVNKLYEKAGD